MADASEWTSLEMAKLAVGILTPLLLFALGFVVTRAARRVEDVQWASRKLIERRLDLFKEMGPKLNDLYCFFMFRGHYREIEPPDAVERKRELDRLFHTHAPLFGHDFAARYHAFIDACFLTFTGVGEDAKLRTSAAQQRQERRSWDEGWDKLFAEGRESSPEEIKFAYEAVMEEFAVEVGARGRGTG